jgi:NADH dehydrogenase FAD-containing subunit
MAPYRCPPGPYERACQVAWYFKTQKPKSKVLILDANDKVQSKEALFTKVWREWYAGIIEYRPNSTLLDVDAKTLTAKLEFEEVKADVLNVVPPQRAAKIAADTGLITANNKWVGVDFLTYESIAKKKIHVLGDAILAAPAMPKSGHMANQHAKVAAAAVIALLRGGVPEPEPRHQQHLLQLRQRQAGDPRGVGPPVRPGEEDHGRGARSFRRVRRPGRTGGELRRIVGQEHLGRYDGLIASADRPCPGWRPLACK